MRRSKSWRGSKGRGSEYRGGTWGHEKQLARFGNKDLQIHSAWLPRSSNRNTGEIVRNSGVLWAYELKPEVQDDWTHCRRHWPSTSNPCKNPISPTRPGPSPHRLFSGLLLDCLQRPDSESRYRSVYKPIYVRTVSKLPPNLTRWSGAKMHSAAS